VENAVENVEVFVLEPAGKEVGRGLGWSSVDKFVCSGVLIYYAGLIRLNLPFMFFDEHFC
jgi:hypothetical protein